MRNYYEVLGIGQDADVNQIKRSYFKLVREYPPERFPEEFKELREAYETLMDEGARREYDRGGELPPDIKIMFDEARKARIRGQAEKALDNLLILQRLYPDALVIKAEIARVYEHMDKYGKAVDVWKELHEQAPDNAEYSLCLAQSYFCRGWDKKAAAQFEATTVIAPTNSEAWAGWIDCCAKPKNYKRALEICETAIAALREGGNESLRIFMSAFLYCMMDLDKEAAIGYLLGIRDALQAGIKYLQEFDELFMMMLSIIEVTDNTDLISYIKEIEELLPDLDGDIKERIRELDALTEIRALKDEGVSSPLIELTELLQRDCGCESCLDTRMALECSILIDIDGYRPHILRLKTEHPDLYKMHAGFYKEALSTHNPEKLLYQRMKALAKKGLEPELIYASGIESQTTSTVRRESAKVGRNDPCPCGSGKKYKKCCG